MYVENNEKKSKLRFSCIQWPYNKKSKTDDDDAMQPEPIEVEFHDSYKPSWGPEGTLLYAIPGKVDISRNKSTQPDAILGVQKGVIVSEGRDIRFAKFTVPNNVSALCPSLCNVSQHILIRISAHSPNSQTSTSEYQSQLGPRCAHGAAAANSIRGRRVTGAT